MYDSREGAEVETLREGEEMVLCWGSHSTAVEECEVLVFCEGESVSSERPTAASIVSVEVRVRGV